MQTALPNVYVTNYQQYINAPFLQDAIANMLTEEDIESRKGESIYVSIAYFTVNKASGYNQYDSVLALSVRGKSYVYKLRHNNEDVYEANKAIINQDFDSVEKRDESIHTLNAAFEALVAARVERICENVIANQ